MNTCVDQGLEAFGVSDFGARQRIPDVREILVSDAVELSSRMPEAIARPRPSQRAGNVH